MSSQSIISFSNLNIEHMPIDACDNSIGISKSGSAGSMVLLGGGSFLICLARMCLTLVTGLPSNLVCFFGLMCSSVEPLFLQCKSHRQYLQHI